MEWPIDAWFTTCDPCPQCKSNDQWARRPHGENILGKGNMVDRWVCNNCGFATEVDPAGGVRHMSDLPRAYLRREPVEVGGVKYFVVKGERVRPVADIPEKKKLVEVRGKAKIYRHEHDDGQSDAYLPYLIQGGKTVYPPCIDCESEDSIAVPAKPEGDRSNSSRECTNCGSRFTDMRVPEDV